MTDIVRRLRDWKEYDEGKINDARVEAADEITALRAENERLRMALEECLPYAQASIGLPESLWPIDSCILKARAALEEK